MLIVANRPSLIESFLIPLVFFPGRCSAPDVCVESPDKNLFKGFTRGTMSDCAAFESAATTRGVAETQLERDEKGDGTSRQTAVLPSHTSKAVERRAGRHVSVGLTGSARSDAQVLEAAWKKDAWIMPLHVRMTDAVTRDLPGFGESLRRLFLSPACSPISLEFRRPYKISDRGSTKKLQKRRLELAILHPSCTA